MAYLLILHNRFERDARKLAGKDKALGKKIEEQVKTILKDPYKGKALKGNMYGFFNFRFNRSPEYRIIYAIYDCNEDSPWMSHFKQPLGDDCEGVVHIIWVLTRENCNKLYKQKRPYFKNFRLD